MERRLSRPAPINDQRSAIARDQLERGGLAMPAAAALHCTHMGGCARSADRRLMGAALRCRCAPLLCVCAAVRPVDGERVVPRAGRAHALHARPLRRSNHSKTNVRSTREAGTRRRTAVALTLAHCTPLVHSPSRGLHRDSDRCRSHHRCCTSHCAHWLCRDAREWLAAAAPTWSRRHSSNS